MKGEGEDKVENGKVKTWEWKGTVCNNGTKVGGCATDVMVINVSVLCFSLSVIRVLKVVAGRTTLSLA